LDSGLVDFFDEEEARKDGLDKKPSFSEPENDSEIELKVFFTYKALPKPHELMWLCYMQCFAKELESKVKDDCDACAQGSDSQFEHASPGGCIDPVADNFEFYYGVTKEWLNLDRIGKLFTTVRRFLGQREIYVHGLVEAAHAYIGGREISWYLNDFKVEESCEYKMYRSYNDGLSNLVKMTCMNLYR
jgi:hypothetical protein